VSGPLVGAKLRVPPSGALPRERLEALLDNLWPRRLGLLVAPAGSGKTTLLARIAATARTPVAWYRAESWDGAGNVFLAHLEAALSRVLEGLPGGWNSVEDAAGALESQGAQRVLVIVDDLHALEGTPAEAAFERLLDYAPASLVFLAASRTQPGFNLPRLRVSGSLLEIGVDDLRFRSWEVEELFRDFYGEPLPPAELAELTRRTEGWAAGLQLFHLATQGKTPEERRRLLAALARGSRFVREYLTSNVLDELPYDLRRFLVETCVLGRLSGPICDRFLGVDQSRLALLELERRQVFTHPLDDGGEYRYHEILRSHLEGVVVQEAGEAELRERHRRAGTVLEEAEALPEALQAYCRAGEWAAAARLLGDQGDHLTRSAPVWLDRLPAAVVDHDPWLLLASARRHRADGLWQLAVETYQRSERASGAAEPGELARRERLALAAWLGPAPGPSGDLVGQLRTATQREPLIAHRQAALAPPAEALASGLGALLAGELREARRRLAEALDAPKAGAAVLVGARLGLGVAELLAGEAAGAAQVARAADEAEEIGLPFLARLARACHALSGGGAAEEAARTRVSCERIGDGWGAALAGLVEGWARCQDPAADGAGEAAPVLREAAAWFRRVEAPVLLTWALGLLALALAREGDPSAEQTALEAERLANARGVEGAKVLAYLALATVSPSRRIEYTGLSASVSAATGLVAAASPDGFPASITLRLFGGFEITVEGSSLDLGALKPRVRMLLRLLAVQSGQPLHREAIQCLLWPDTEAEAAARNLHVAISSLRQALAPAAEPAGGPLLVREGDAYRLALGPGTEVDLTAFEEESAAGRRARSVGDAAGAARRFRRALELYRGELLPEDGAADWLLEPRERCRAAAVEAAQTLAELTLEAGDGAEAARVCAAGLRVDRYDDALWRLLVKARQLAGDRLAASRAMADYERVLSELGVPAATAT
jgi:DNA-binding SARP family transcriptional activator